MGDGPATRGWLSDNTESVCRIEKLAADAQSFLGRSGDGGVTCVID